MLPDQSAGVDWRRAVTARARTFGSMLPVLAVAVVLLAAATSFFPNTATFPDVPVLNTVTPLRLAILAGLIALVVSGARLAAFRTRIDIAVGVLLLVSLAETVLNRRSGAPLRQLLVEIAVFYLVVAVRRTYSRSWAPVAMLALISVATAGLVALGQVANQTFTGFCGGGFFGDVQCGHGALIRADGTFANPNELAAFLLLLVPVATCAVSLVRERLTRAMLTGLAVVGWLGVLATYSRAAFVGVLVSLALVFGARRLFPRLSPRRLTLAIAGVTVVLSTSAGVLAILLQTRLSAGGRGVAWVAAVRSALSHPLLGVGLGRGGSVITVTTGQQFAHAHNLWLNWLLETGFPGFLAIIAVTVVAMVSAAHRAARGSIIGTAELAGFTGFLLMSLFDDPANLSRIAMAMWLALGLIMAETPARWREPEAEDEAADVEDEIPDPEPEDHGPPDDDLTQPLPKIPEPVRKPPPTGRPPAPVPTATGGRHRALATRPAVRPDPLGDTQPVPPAKATPKPEKPAGPPRWTPPPPRSQPRPARDEPPPPAPRAQPQRPARQSPPQRSQPLPQPPAEPRATPPGQPHRPDRPIRRR